MNTLPTTTNLYYILIFVFLASFTTLVLILIYSFYTWLVTRKKNVIYKQLYEVDPRSDAYKQALKIIEDARIKSIELLKNAHLEKQDIIESSAAVEKEIKTLFEENAKQLSKKQQADLDSLSYEFIEQYKSTLDEEKIALNKSIADVSHLVTQGLLEEVKDFSNQLKNTTYESQKLIDQKIQNEYELAQKEIQKYKEDTLARISNSSADILRQLTQDLLNKSISAEEHELIIKKSLEMILENSDFKSI